MNMNDEGDNETIKLRRQLKIHSTVCSQEVEGEGEKKYAANEI